jgi:hypothetical protein
MASDQTLIVEGTLSGRLIVNLNYYARIYACWFPYQPLKLHASSVADSCSASSSIVATGMSCGVDSLATAYDLGAGASGSRLTHFVHCNVGSHGHGEAARELFHARLGRARLAAVDVGLPLIEVDSNIDEFISVRFEDSYAARTAAVAHFLGCSEYFIASTNTYEQIGPEGSSPLSDNLLSSPRVQVFHDGAHLNRIEKLALIKLWPLARKHLNVCTRNTGDAGNCSSCGKCLRTILAIWLLESWPYFENVFQSANLKEKLLSYVVKMNEIGLIPPQYYWMEISELAAKRGFDLQRDPNLAISRLARRNLRPE